MSANFTPDFKGYTGQGAFRFWCQTALPLIYDDSLSYYELLNKMVVYLNNVISDVGSMEDNVNALLSAYNQLQGYVNTYFDNLDVQEEINRKLDAMAEGGTLSTLMAPFVADGLPSVVGDQIDAVVASQIDASVGSQIDESVASQIASPVATNVTTWLNEYVTPVGSAVVVDESLSISGAAADAKVTGELTQTPELFGCKLFCSSRSMIDNYNKFIYDGTYEPQGFVATPTTKLTIPEYTVGTGYHNVGYVLDTKDVITATSDMSTIKLRLCVKLKNETNTEFLVRLSHYKKWTNYTSYSKSFTCAHSGYYDVTLDQNIFNANAATLRQLSLEGNITNVEFIYLLDETTIIDPVIADKTLTISGGYADAKVTGELTQTPELFGCKLFCSSRLLVHDANHYVYDGGLAPIQTIISPTKQFKIATYEASSGTFATGYALDTNGCITVTGDTQNVSIHLAIKLKVENKPSEFEITMTGAHNWGPNTSVFRKAFTIYQSGYYDFTLDLVHYNSNSPLLSVLFINGKDTNIDYLYMMDTNHIEQKEPAMYDIIFWGDSLTAGAGGSGTTYPEVCSNSLGLNYRNCGVGGESSNTIAARQGGNNLIIPAGAVNGSYDYTDFVDPFGGAIRPLRQGNGEIAGSNKLIINGEKCNLSISQTSSTSTDAVYTISGYTGSAIMVPMKARFIGGTFTSNICVIWIGQNGSTITGESNDVKARIALIDSMIANANTRKVVVLALSSGTDETRNDEDLELLKHYGSLLFQTRKMLVNYGLTLQGITPTSTDLTDISVGRVPTSLRSDHTHLNADGYTALGKMLANHIRALGYVD